MGMAGLRMHCEGVLITILSDYQKTEGCQALPGDPLILLGAVPPIVLDPDPAQDRNRGDLPQPGWCVRMLDGGEQPAAIVANSQGEGSSCCLGGRESVIFSPPCIAVPPLARVVFYPSACRA